MRTIIATLLCSLALLAADPLRRAPGFSLPDLMTKQHDLADFRGKVVVLEFMQTTCPHCVAFTAALDKVRQKYGDKVAIVAIVNPPDDQGKVAAFTVDHKIGYPILFDCGQVAYSYLLSVQFEPPQVFLINGDGMIQNHFEYGATTRDIFEGNGLVPEIERLFAPAAGAPEKK